MSTTEVTVIVLGILVLSYLSGMLGLGVAFAAVPFLSFFLSDLVNEVQPLSLLLNGVTAMVAAIGFALSGFIDWRKAIGLATTDSSDSSAWRSRPRISWGQMGTFPCQT